MHGKALRRAVASVIRAGTVEAFVEDLEGHGDTSEKITAACIDMSRSYMSGVVGHHRPNAAITFDRFHVMRLANGAVEEGHRAESLTLDVAEGQVSLVKDPDRAAPRPVAPQAQDRALLPDEGRTPRQRCRGQHSGPDRDAADRLNRVGTTQPLCAIPQQSGTAR